MIIDLINTRCVSSQDELAALLSERGCQVTQATLSRDLKLLKTSKVPTDKGSYMYILPDTNAIKDKLLATGQAAINPVYQSGFISLDFAGNLAVIKTRNGYAPGLAYDIDISKAPEFLGTIPGTDTIFVVIREGVTHEQAREAFARYLPLDDKIPYL